MTFDEYPNNIGDKWKDSFLKTWNTVEEHLSDGFIMDIQHGMPGSAVPKSTYPEGCHVNQTPSLHRKQPHKTPPHSLPYGHVPR